MTLLACIPVTGCLTLAEVADCSLTTADQTFTLDAGTQVLFENSGGDTLFEISDVDNYSWTYGQAGVSPPSLAWSEAFSIDYTATDTSINPVVGIASYIGADPSANSGMDYVGGVFQSFTEASNNKNFNSLQGLQGGTFHHGSGVAQKVMGLLYQAWLTSTGNVAELIGIELDVQTAPGSTGAVTAFMLGIRALARDFGSGNIALQAGIFATSAYSTGSGTIAAGYGIKIDASTGSNITLGVGLDIGNQSAATTNYAILTRAGQVVINEDGDNDTDFRVEGATNAHLLFTDGSTDRIGINDSTPDGKLDIVQSSTTEAIPVVELEQLDLSEEFFNFVGTVATGNPIEAVGAKILTVTHFIRVAVNGSFLYLPVGTIA